MSFQNFHTVHGMAEVIIFTTDFFLSLNHRAAIASKFPRFGLWTSKASSSQKIQITSHSKNKWETDSFSAQKTQVLSVTSFLFPRFSLVRKSLLLVNSHRNTSTLGGMEMFQRAGWPTGVTPLTFSTAYKDCNLWIPDLCIFYVIESCSVLRETLEIICSRSLHWFIICGEKFLLKESFSSWPSHTSASSCLFITDKIYYIWKSLKHFSS